MNGFLRRIATKQLGIPLEEYEDQIRGLSLEETEEFLAIQANAKKQGIPDIKKIMESVLNDQAMASRCHKEWLPPSYVYQGDVMYIQAANDKFCRKIKGIGSSADCWSLVLQKKITTVTCSGHHYSMMDSKRGPDVGKVVSVAAQIKFRSLFSKRYRIVENGCHKQAIADCKRSGLKAVFIKKTAQFNHPVFGEIMLSNTQKRLKFIPESKVEALVKLRLKDVKNITHMDLFGSEEYNKLRDIEKFNLYAGLCLMTNNNTKYRFLFLNRQDYKRFIHTLEATYSIKLPF